MKKLDTFEDDVYYEIVDLTQEREKADSSNNFHEELRLRSVDCLDLDNNMKIMLKTYGCINIGDIMNNMNAIFNLNETIGLGKT